MSGCFDPFTYHLPVVQLVAGKNHIVCGRCGLMLDFRPLEEVGFNVSDWAAPIYAAPMRHLHE